MFIFEASYGSLGSMLDTDQTGSKNKSRHGCSVGCSAGCSFRCSSG